MSWQLSVVFWMLALNGLAVLAVGSSPTLYAKMRAKPRLEWRRNEILMTLAFLALIWWGA